MKKIILFIITVLVIAACAPSETAIQTAMAQTQVVLQTNSLGPTPTPIPTNTLLTETLLPTVTPTPLSEPIILNGRGDSVVDISKWDGPAILHVTHRGGSRFEIWNTDSNGNRIDELVFTSGSYQGTLLIDMRPEHTTGFEITAGGIWEIQVLPFDVVRTENIPGTFQGVGDDVIFLSGTGKFDPADLIIIKIIDSGPSTPDDSSLIIYAYGSYDVTSIKGPYYSYDASHFDNNTITLGSDTYLLVIYATAPWSIEVTRK